MVLDPAASDSQLLLLITIDLASDEFALKRSLKKGFYEIHQNLQFNVKLMDYFPREKYFGDKYALKSAYCFYVRGKVDMEL